MLNSKERILEYMKVTDYIIEFLIGKQITDIFGYPGGVICHLIDSATKYSNKIKAHASCHEQGAAFAACGYALNSGKLGVAYSTSGPGATNLVTGVANAYFDSIPTMFFTGQVDTYALKGTLNVRQRGFQETDIVSLMKPVSKYVVCIDDPDNIKYELEKAYYIAVNGNPGPVVIDLPADIQRADIDIDKVKSFKPDVCNKIEVQYDAGLELIKKHLERAKRPCFLLGNAIKQSKQRENMKYIIHTLKIPAIFSMPAFDILPYDDEYNYGFIGANGHRYGNFILGKSDLIISIGSRLDLKQVGNNREEFVPSAKIIRVDIDEGNLLYKVHSDEIQIVADIKLFIPFMVKKVHELKCCDSEWILVCNKIKKHLMGYDDKGYNHFITRFSKCIPANYAITADVGQSEVWIAQNFHVKNGQSVHISAGHGAMGFSVPAAIGVHYSSIQPVISFNGDGGLQMNIQELQFIKRESLPIKVVVINNYSLGMIRSFQKENFKENYSQTTENSGYLAPDFEKLAKAYGLKYYSLGINEEINPDIFHYDEGCIIEVFINEDTILEPNFGRNGLIQDQRPYLERGLFEDLMRL